MTRIFLLAASALCLTVPATNAYDAYDHGGSEQQGNYFLGQYSYYNYGQSGWTLARYARQGSPLSVAYKYFGFVDRGDVNYYTVPEVPNQWPIYGSSYVLSEGYWSSSTYQHAKSVVYTDIWSPFTFPHACGMVEDTTL